MAERFQRLQDVVWGIDFSPPEAMETGYMIRFPKSEMTHYLKARGNRMIGK
jgi:hypothetical protein